MRKNILIVYPGPIFPIDMGSKVRVYNMIKGLSQDHNVDVIAKVNKEHLSFSNINHIKNICNNYYPILSPNKKNLFLKVFYKITYRLSCLPSSLFYSAISSYIKDVSRIANKKIYDIIICEYWYSCTFYRKLDYRPFFVLDTHDINFEKFEKNVSKNNKSCTKVKKYKNLELKYTSFNDLIISISQYDHDFFSSYFPLKKHIKICIGQDLSIFLNNDYKNFKKDNIILFYGNMRGKQNIDAFYRLYNQILPKILSKIPEVKLIVLGADPPEDIKKKHNGGNIIITGYVDSLQEWIARSTIMILPLDLGGGFRTRVVEVMAMGVPVIGTNNALNSIEMVSGEHGYITDNDEEIANYAVSLMKNNKLRKEMSVSCQNFVKERYTIEATYGKLSEYLSKINHKC